MHSEEHKNNAKPPEIPWHDHVVNDDMPTYPNAPNKRTPIRGLQFFMPSTAWFCKLCAFWIGDLHCASTHLKSVTHAAKYEEFIAKNPSFEAEWLEERRAALESFKERAAAKQNAQEPLKENVIIPPPPPPAVVAVKPVQPPPNAIAATNPFAPNAAVFDGIPLKIAQRTKENSISEDSSKKSKKRKKDKKKRKKSKRKHHRRSSSSSSTSSSSSSDEDSSNSSSEQQSSEQTSSPEKPSAPDTSSSIRVAMRNAGAPPQDGDIKPQNGGEVVSTGGWMVVQEQKVVVPQPPTISANGEAQNRRDDAIISQWSAPVQPVISAQEKQLLVQLKDKLKGREESKKEKTPQPIVHEETPKEVSTAVEKRDDTDKRRVDRERMDRDKDRRDTSYRRRRTRSRSISSSKRDR